jgi:hypothetical protein
MMSSTQLSAVSSQLVRARRKPVDQMPEWALCCRAMREAIKASGADPPVCLVDPTYVLFGQCMCWFCGRITPGLRYVKVVRELSGRFFPLKVGQMRAAIIECFEFDEGLAES